MPFNLATAHGDRNVGAAQLRIQAEGEFKGSVYCTLWPTMSSVLEELSLRELLVALLGDD